MFRNVLLKGKLNTSEYMLTHDGTVRHTLPFFRKFDTRAKERMLGKPFIETYCSEFVLPEEVFVGMCENGFLRLNKKKVTDYHHIIGYKDSFQTDEIRTDKPVSNFDSIEIIYEDEELLVVAKPENVPTHRKFYCGLNDQYWIRSGTICKEQPY